MPLIVIWPSTSTSSPVAADASSVLEAHLGMALGVEELGGEQVRLEVLVLDADGGDACDAGQPAVGEGRLEVAHGAAEGRDGVRHLEGDARVHGVGLPGARWGSAVDCSVMLMGVSS